MSPIMIYTCKAVRLNFAVLSPDYKPGQRIYDEIVAIACMRSHWRRYRPIFSSEHILSLDQGGVHTPSCIPRTIITGAVLIEGLGTAEDMKTLRQALALLLDENSPLQERFRNT